MPVREREKVQKMLRFLTGCGRRGQTALSTAAASRATKRLSAGTEKSVPFFRSLLICVVAAGAGQGAVFPDALKDYQKGPIKTILTPDTPLLNEFGLDATEQAEYSSGAKHFTATAWRFHDATGAMAMFESKRPSGAKPGKVTNLSVTTSDGVIFAYGNYVFQVTGNLPTPAVFAELYARLPKLEQSPLPALLSDLPADGLIPNSERYILGPVSLDRFAPKIAPSVAAFHLGSEGVAGKYRTDQGTLTLAIFNFPTPNLARDRYQEFQKIPGAIAKRAGPLVAVTLDAPDPDAAERLLSRVKYETNVTLNQHVPVNDTVDKIKFILNVFVFAGLLIGLCLAAGLLYAGFRIVSRKMNHGEDRDAMITLHLGK